MTVSTTSTLCEDTLQKTMELFWKKGFSNTSMDEIVMVTGFNRAAIYRNFGGKQGLFLAMLNRFYEKYASIMLMPLFEKPQGLINIQKFFMQFIDFGSTLMSRGCFFVATASEMSTGCDEINQFVRNYFKKLRQLFLRALKAAQKNHEIKADLNINMQADFLVGNIYGLTTQCRSAASAEALKHHVSSLESYLLTLKVTHD